MKQQQSSVKISLLLQLQRIQYSMRKQNTSKLKILTKPLGKIKFKKLRYDIGVHSMKAKEENYEMANHALANTHGEQHK
ncbi:hypothetical protein EPI10_030759 [Gossypium australe]|uniref:Uncharacterized protein n=1 Tax=Gossypium australe TaxID=47621 RepID=A0A5B6WYC0_9ROSI|nr:hypothetical protein EPI10_030759 [Gossypium australe]